MDVELNGASKHFLCYPEEIKVLAYDLSYFTFIRVTTHGISSMSAKDSHESYLHYYAKQVLIQWLKAANGRFFSLRWNPYGQRIYDEYPLLLDEKGPTHGIDDVPFDEIPAWICTCPVVYSDLLLTSAINPCRHHLQRPDNIPTRQEIMAYGHKVGAIVDVAIVDEGRVKYIFEIVHTSGLTPMKKKLLCKYSERYNCTAYTVDVNYVLRQVCSPSVWRGVKVIEDKKERRQWKPRKFRRRK